METEDFGLFGDYEGFMGFSIVLEFFVLIGVCFISFLGVASPSIPSLESGLLFGVANLSIVGIFLLFLARGTFKNLVLTSSISVSFGITFFLIGGITYFTCF